MDLDRNSAITDDILEEILRYLNLRELCTASLVSKQFHRVSLRDSIWVKFFLSGCDVSWDVMLPKELEKTQQNIQDKATWKERFKYFYQHWARRFMKGVLYTLDWFLFRSWVILFTKETTDRVKNRLTK